MLYRIDPDAQDDKGVVGVGETEDELQVEAWTGFWLYIWFKSIIEFPAVFCCLMSCSFIFATQDLDILIKNLHRTAVAEGCGSNFYLFCCGRFAEVRSTCHFGMRNRFSFAMFCIVLPILARWCVCTPFCWKKFACGWLQCNPTFKW